MRTGKPKFLLQHPITDYRTTADGGPRVVSQEVV